MLCCVSLTSEVSVVRQLVSEHHIEALQVQRVLGQAVDASGVIENAARDLAVRAGLQTSVRQAGKRQATGQTHLYGHQPGNRGAKSGVAKSR